MRGYLIAVALVVWAASLAWCAHTAFQRGYAAGSNAEVVAQTAAATKARQQAEARQSDAAEAGNAMRAHLDITLPAIEVRSDDTRTAIRTIYLAQPAADAALCRRPDGVQAQLDAAVDRANAAARGDVRPDTATPPTAEGAVATKRRGSG